MVTSSASKSPLPLSSPGKEAGTGSSRNGASGARCCGSPPGPPHSAGGSVQSLPPARALSRVGTQQLYCSPTAQVAACTSCGLRLRSIRSWHSSHAADMCNQARTTAWLSSFCPQ